MCFLPVLKISQGDLRYKECHRMQFLASKCMILWLYRSFKPRERRRNATFVHLITNFSMNSFDIFFLSRIEIFQILIFQILQCHKFKNPSHVDKLFYSPCYVYVYVSFVGGRPESLVRWLLLDRPRRPALAVVWMLSNWSFDDTGEKSLGRER